VDSDKSRGISKVKVELIDSNVINAVARCKTAVINGLIALDSRAPIVQKQLESRNTGMLCQEGTLLDPTVGLGSTPLLQNFKFLISKRRCHFRVGPLVQLIIAAITK